MVSCIKLNSKRQGKSEGRNKRGRWDMQVEGRWKRWEMEEGNSVLEERGRQEMRRSGKGKGKVGEWGNSRDAKVDGGG